MSRRIFREEALRRHSDGRGPRARTVELGARRFAVLWLVVAVLGTALALLARPLFMAEAPAPATGAPATERGR